MLDLTLGPLDLNLLGLMVHLGGGASGNDTLHLTITADPTKGLLGSLLCSLAGRTTAALPDAAPDSLGLDPERLARIDEAVRRAVERHSRDISVARTRI